MRSILSAWKSDIDGLLWQQAAGGAAVLELTKMGVGILAPPGRPPPSVTVATPAVSHLPARNLDCECELAQLKRIDTHTHILAICHC